MNVIMSMQQHLNFADDYIKPSGIELHTVFLKAGFGNS